MSGSDENGMARDAATSKILAAAFGKAALPGDLGGFGSKARAEAAAFAAAALAVRKPKQSGVLIDTLVAADGRRQMRLAVSNADMPFLVDSIAAVVAAHGLVIERLLHPVFKAERDKSGKLISLNTGTARESLVYIETERADAKVRTDIRQTLLANLAHVRDAVADWEALKAAIEADAQRIEPSEEATLLHWFADNHFTLLGAARFLPTGEIVDAIGIARGTGAALLSESARAAAFEALDVGAPILIVKSNLLSPVHRRVPLDLLIIPHRKGTRIECLSIHAGLWTSNALSAPPQDVPVLRRSLQNLQAKFRFDPAGHAGKALGHALASLPHDIMISVSEADLERLALAAMSIADRPRPKLELISAPLGRHLFAFVWLPRDELSSNRRIAIAELLCEAASASLLNWTIQLEDGESALLRFTLDLRQGGIVPSVGPLNAKISSMVRGWKSAVETSLGALGDHGNATRLAIRYADALPINYRNGAGPQEAALDIVELNQLADDSTRRVRFYRNDDDENTVLRMKLYSLTPIALSEIVPALENFGFRVMEELSTKLEGGKLGQFQRFVLQAPKADGAVGIVKRADMLGEALSRVLEGVAEDDLFNQLNVALGLGSAEIILMRALFRYLRQTGMTYGQTTVVNALRNAPEVAIALTALFAARHNPAAQAQASRASSDADAAIRRGLTRVSAIDDDRILRAYRAVILATLRTNFYAPAAREALAFKIDSAAVPGLPDPKPWREVFVYSPRVEGIHLRAGPIARGGLRWSDRRDDFRTEVLGLMKAQRVKNAVIVPTGAKGGFYPKQLPDPAISRDAWLAEGTESYRIFIRTLLSLTDNLVEGEVVHPDYIVRHDGDDPYFVVAADKGTATFSDVANAIALERGFWLGDAFASGGSVGYDHKAMGITAKGGWISVRRHFAEMGVDIQKEAVRVVGCGDMSGDVFGNGMLLSKSIKLVAAFDHRHIFFDPDPDPAISWKERARMFKLPRSSWADYNAKLISRGGGVFPRSAKEIRLSSQLRAMLGVTEASMEPSAIIVAILKAEVGLIWFGGIGTYVKARAEGNADVGDRANDANRINAEDVRASVIGEGANLGITQAARIAFALKGGRINTDFIDNSAGVDCSDNEVNIKIALGAEVAAGTLKMPARNALLARMTDDVAALVLEDNRLQTLALSIAEREGAAALPSQLRLIESFETAGKLDRAVEGVATNDELTRRAAEGKGLTRPELAVVMATAKLMLQDAIETSTLPQDAATDADLMSAFPAEMQSKHRAAIESHRLRGEIIATKLANRIVNRLGLIHPFELAEEEGCLLDDVAEAFVIAEKVYDIPALWETLDTADMPEASRLMLFEQVAFEMRAHMADILRNSVADRTNDKAISVYRPAVARIAASIDTLLPAEAERQTRAYAEKLIRHGAPRKIAERIVRLAELDGAIGVVALAARKGLNEVAITRAFTHIGEAMGLDWAQGTAMQLDPSDPWERLLAAGLARDFQAMRLDFIARIGGSDPEVATSAWLLTHTSRVITFRTMIERAKGSVATSAMLAQIAGQARVLLAR